MHAKPYRVVKACCHGRKHSLQAPHAKFFTAQKVAAAAGQDPLMWVARLRQCAMPSQFVRHRTGSGAADAKQMEALLATKHGIRLASGLWSRYMRGDVLPQGSLGNAKGSLLRRLDILYPRTAPVFDHPVWSVLNWSDTFDLGEIRDIYLALGETVSVHFVLKVQVGKMREHSKVHPFWHLQKSTEERRRVLEGFTPWTRLVVSLLEARMSYAGQRHEAFVDCQLIACGALREIQKVSTARRTGVISALLMMESICLNPLIFSTIKPLPASEKTTFLLERSLEWQKDWANRGFEFLETAPIKLRKSFLSKLKEESSKGERCYLPRKMELCLSSPMPLMGEFGDKKPRYSFETGLLLKL